MNYKDFNYSLIISGILVLVIALDLMNFIATNLIVIIILYVILSLALVVSIIKSNIPHKGLISLIVSIAAFTIIIVSHFILINNPYTYHYVEVDGGIKITGYSFNITNYYEEFKIDIPSQINGKNVKVIGEQAFAYSKDLPIDVYIPDTIEIIEKKAFSNADIRNLILSKELKYVGDYAFENVDFYYTIIPKSVTYIGENAFNGNVMFVALENNENIEKWNESWTETSKIYYDVIEVQKNEGVYYVLLNDKTATVSAILSSSTVEVLPYIQYKNEEYIVTTIDSRPLYGQNYNGIIIPNTVTTIKAKSFSNNDNLTYIYIPSSVINVEENILLECTNVEIYIAHFEKPVTWHENWHSGNKNIYWGSLN